MARSPPLLCELARDERRRLGGGAKTIGVPEHSNDAKVCSPESSIFERAGESTRQKVARKLPSRSITTRHNAAYRGKVIVLGRLFDDEPQRVHLANAQTHFEHRMTLKVPTPKSLNLQRNEDWRKMFPEICPSDASQSGKMRHREAK